MTQYDSEKSFHKMCQTTLDFLGKVGSILALGLVASLMQSLDCMLETFMLLAGVTPVKAINARVGLWKMCHFSQPSCFHLFNSVWTVNRYSNQYDLNWGRPRRAVDCDRPASWAPSYATSWCQAIFSKGSGCGSVGRAVASNTRGPRFESSHWQKFIRTKGGTGCTGCF